MIDYSSLIDIAARGGGGDSGGGGGGAGIIVIPLIIAGAIITWIKRRKRILHAELKQAEAVRKDSTWSDKVIAESVEKIFYRFQYDWSVMDLDSMQNYLTPSYHQHMSLVLAAMAQMNRRNELTNVKLVKQTLFGVHDHDENEQDSFNVEIKGKLNDHLVNLKTNEVLKVDSPTFTEIWHFEREGKNWALDNITQINKDGLVHQFDPVKDNVFVKFAEKNNFFYNADFGWLLLPFEGRLFSQSSWGSSDINHHVIGLYKGVIVQFFQYTPLVHGKISLLDQLQFFYREDHKLAKYTVAKATLPRSYSNIVVKRRNPLRFFRFKPYQLRQVKLESNDFNNQFDVYASDIDKVSSLELLHPAYMAKLIDLPFKLNLEIVGTTLYLYSSDTKTDYDVMLEMLGEAFKEMKM